MTQGAYDLIAAQDSSDDGSDVWDKDTFSTLSPWMAAEVKEMQIAAQRNTIHKWLGAVEY